MQSEVRNEMCACMYGAGLLIAKEGKRARRDIVNAEPFAHAHVVRSSRCNCNAPYRPPAWAVMLDVRTKRIVYA